jgi:S1-C subfamily serine protease
VRQFPARLFLDFTMTYKLKITLMVAQIVSATFNAKQAVALTTAEIVAKAKPAVVSIEQIDTINNQAWQGTGWFYGDGKTVVTNAHILTGTYNVLKVHNVATGKEYTIDHVNYLNPKDDVAALTVREENDGFLAISDVAPVEGNNVTVIGNPKEHYGTVTTGIVSALRSDPKAGSTMQISAPISHGSSGSPVLNDNGEAIGMVWGGDPQTDAHDLNYAVPQDILKSDLFGVSSFNIGGPLAFATLPSAQSTQSPTNGTVRTASSLPAPSQFGATRQSRLYTFTRVLGDKQAIIGISLPVVTYLKNMEAGVRSDGLFLQKLDTYLSMHNVTYDQAAARDRAYFKAWPNRKYDIDYENIVIEKLGWDGPDVYMVTVPFRETIKKGKIVETFSRIAEAYVMPSRHQNTGIEDYFISSVWSAQS